MDQVGHSCFAFQTSDRSMYDGSKFRMLARESKSCKHSQVQEQEMRICNRDATVHKENIGIQKESGAEQCSFLFISAMKSLVC
jgi:hypothetical protein